MLESNLHAGKQTLSGDRSQLKYGVSITDACIDWLTTERAIRKAHRRLLKLRQEGPGLTA
jgi:3-deoxy-7-phosphoheptulonate synthase